MVVVHPNKINDSIHRNVYRGVSGRFNSVEFDVETTIPLMLAFNISEQFKLFKNNQLIL